MMLFLHKKTMQMKAFTKLPSKVPRGISSSRILNPLRNPLPISLLLWAVWGLMKMKWRKVVLMMFMNSLLLWAIWVFEGIAQEILPVLVSWLRSFRSLLPCFLACHVSSAIVCLAVCGFVLIVLPCTVLLVSCDCCLMLKSKYPMQSYFIFGLYVAFSHTLFQLIAEFISRIAVVLLFL